MGMESNECEPVCSGAGMHRWAASASNSPVNRSALASGAGVSLFGLPASALFASQGASSGVSELPGAAGTLVPKKQSIAARGTGPTATTGASGQGAGAGAGIGKKSPAARGVRVGWEAVEGPGSKNVDQTIATVATDVSDRCAVLQLLAQQAASAPELTDELFLQLIKQTFDSPGTFLCIHLFPFRFFHFSYRFFRSLLLLFHTICMQLHRKWVVSLTSVG